MRAASPSLLFPVESKSLLLQVEVCPQRRGLLNQWTEWPRRIQVRCSPNIGCRTAPLMLPFLLIGWLASAEETPFNETLGQAFFSCAAATLSVLRTSDRQFLPELSAMLHSPMRRIYTWRVPPHWSRNDWLEEMRAQGAAAVWQALCDYDASRGVPLPAFIHLRVTASAFTRYRQEWGYAAHCVCQADEKARDRASIAEDSPFPPAVRELLQSALAQLSEPERGLIKQLFWEGHTEAEVAQRLGISHQAVSKRKQSVLQYLRTRLGVDNKNLERVGCKKRQSLHIYM